MPTSARTRAVASRGGCGGCEGGVHRRTSVAAVGARIARQDTYDMRAPPSNVPGRDSTVGADAYIGPNPPQAGPFDESAQAARARLPPAGDFSPQKSSQNAPGAAAPGPPFRPRGVHPKERHHPGRCAPPGRPVRCCLPLQGFARDSKIAEPLRLRGDSLRPHPLPRNGADYSTRQLLKRHNPSVTASP